MKEVSRVKKANIPTLASSRKTRKKNMKKIFNIDEEIMARLQGGKCVQGSLHMDKWTGRLTFNAFNRKPRARHERVICQLENGWLKESPKRIKFYNSVKKELGQRMVDVVMHRELKHAMGVLEIEQLLDTI